MRVQDMQQFLTSFTEGSDAVKNAVIFAEVNGTLYDIRRMEVHENAEPVIVGLGKMRSAHRLVLKTVTESKILMPEKLRPDY